MEPNRLMIAGYGQLANSLAQSIIKKDMGLSLLRETIEAKEVEQRLVALKKEAERRCKRRASKKNDNIIMEIQELERQLFMKRVMIHFTEIIGLYQVVTGQVDSDEHTE